MGDDGRILPWKQRVAQQYQQAFEQHDAGIGDGEISVMWASSQGGCGPLKRLLRDVESKLTPTLLLSDVLTHFSPSFKSLKCVHGWLKSPICLFQVKLHLQVLIQYALQAPPQGLYIDIPQYPFQEALESR